MAVIDGKHCRDKQINHSARQGCGVLWRACLYACEYVCSYTHISRTACSTFTILSLLVCVCVCVCVTVCVRDYVCICTCMSSVATARSLMVACRDIVVLPVSWTSRSPVMSPGCLPVWRHGSSRAAICIRSNTPASWEELVVASCSSRHLTPRPADESSGARGGVYDAWLLCF